LRLTTRLFALVALALLPAIAIQAYNEFALRDARQEAAHEQALSAARAVATVLDRFVEGVRQVLVAVAETPGIKDKDPGRCTAYLQRVAKSYPAYMLLAVNDAEGRTVCNTAGGGPGTNSNAGRAYFQRAMASNGFAVGDQVIGVETKRRSLHLALPLPDATGEPGGIVLVSLDLDWLTSHLSTGLLPPEATLTILDRPGTVLVRVPDNGGWAGKPPPADFKAALLAPGDTVVERPGLDGRARILGIVHPGGQLNGLTVSVGLSHEIVYADINAATTRGVTLIALGALLGVIGCLARRAGTHPQTHLGPDFGRRTVAPWRLVRAHGSGQWVLRTSPPRNRI
jgi:hypothetical protein